MFRSLLLTYLIIQISMPCFGQLENYSIKKFDQRDGLPDEGLRDLFFDNQSRLWIATTSTGVSVFDGKTFRTITENDSLSNNFSFRIAQGRKGEIWVATRNGVSKIEGQKIDNFLISNPVDRSGFFTNILIDKKDRIYAMGFPGIFQLKENKFEKITIGNAKRIMHAYCNPDNDIYFATDIGIIIWRDGKIKEIIDSKRGITAKNIFRIKPHSDSSLIIAAFDGLFVYNTLSKKGKHIKLDNDKIISAIGMEKIDGKNWLITDGSGKLYILNGEKLKLLEWEYQDDIVDIKSDPIGNIWMSGRYLYKLKPSLFTKLLYKKSTVNKPLLWQTFEAYTQIGYYENKLVTIQNGKIFKYVLKEKISSVNYKNGYYYIGCIDGSVISIHKGKIKKEIKEKTLQNQNDEVRTLFIDENNNIWAGRNYSVILKIPGLKEKSIPYSDSNRLASYSIIKKNDILVVSNEKGIYKLANDTVLYPIVSNYNFSHAIRCSNIDEFNRIWFAEDGKGIGIIERTGKTFFIPNPKSVSLIDIESIHFIKEKGTAYLKNSRGLVQIKYDINGILEINRIPFESIGMSIFSTTTNQVVDSLFITDQNYILYKNNFHSNKVINNFFIRLKKDDSKNDKILKFENYDVKKVEIEKGGGIYSIEIHSTKCFQNTDQLIKYSLEGKEQSFTRIQAENNLNLGYLKPGKYELTIREGENEFMVEKAAPYKLMIIIPPLWYQTSIFSLIIFLSISFIIVHVIRLYIKKIEEKKRRNIENEKKKFELENTILKNQLDPHIVFNLLNNVHSKILFSSKEKASESIIKLSKFMRQSLEISKRSNISILEEIEYIKEYLNFKIELQENIQIYINIEIPVEIKDTLIPSLLWQPLIENAVKYVDGESKFITASFFIENMYLIGSIENSISNSVDLKYLNETGNGIRLVRERIDLLNQLYGSGLAYFKLNKSNLFFSATIGINLNKINRDTEIQRTGT